MIPSLEAVHRIQRLGLVILSIRCIKKKGINTCCVVLPLTETGAQVCIVARVPAQQTGRNRPNYASSQSEWLNYRNNQGTLTEERINGDGLIMHLPTPQGDL